MSSSLEYLQSLIASQRPFTETADALMAWSRKALEQQDYHSTFYMFLPSLLSYLFGTETHLGVIRRLMNDRDRVALYNLLAPSGPFMSLIIKLSGDSSMVYDFSPQKLPDPARRSPGADKRFPWQRDAKDNSGRLGLDSLYYMLLRAYLNFFAPPGERKNGPETPASSRSKALFSTPGEGVRKRAGAGAGDSHEGYADSAAGGRVRSSPGPQRESSQITVLTHRLVLIAIGDHLIVLRYPRIPNLFFRPSMSFREFDVLGDRRENPRLAISQFAIGIFVDLWLNQVKFVSDGNQQKPVIEQLSQGLMNCILILVSHFGAMDMRSLQYNASPAAQRELTGFAKDQYTIAVMYHMTLQKPLYNFLAITLKSWEANENYKQLVDLWLAYISAWRANYDPVSGRTVRDQMTFSEDWVMFTAHNFPFYTRLLNIFMERAVTFDLFAAVRPSEILKTGASSTNLATGHTIYQATSTAIGSSLRTTPIRWYMVALEKVLQFYCNTEELLPVLRSMEHLLAAMTSATAYTGSDVAQTPGTPATPKSPGSVVRQRSGSIAGFVAGPPPHAWILKVGVELITSIIGGKIVEMEGKPDYRTMFISDPSSSGAGYVLGKTMAGNISNTIRRLKTYEVFPKSPSTALEKTESTKPKSLTIQTGQGKETSPSTSDTSIVYYKFPKLPEFNFPSIALFIWLMLFVLLNGTAKWIYHNVIQAGSGNAIDAKHRNESVGASIGRLKVLQELTGQVFNVVIESENGQEEEVEQTQAALAAEESQKAEAYFRNIAPGVIGPEVYGKNGSFLTDLGRYQIKRGVRVCYQNDIPILKTPGLEKLILSYEIEWIVHFTVWLADTFDARYSNLRAKYTVLPAGLGLYWLRFFAAKQNLLFSALVLFASFIFVQSYMFAFGSRPEVVKYATSSKAGHNHMQQVRFKQQNQQYQGRQQDRLNYGYRS
ncbi:sphingomyelin phosphodiesterase 4, neutral membrane (neutral sphingomyelinase-3) [Blyttiomyces sp. JEL0837]|nr:sphingomyelin phosphodiesterase 4, neutral membrane (neutral sphingomyelinase-3) [Blyttiomyces sp. JEL0837]